jgi:hypothetical protein
LQLAWLNAELEKGNHDGAISTHQEVELEALSAKLVDEAPALVCQADLNRCVRRTNAFLFDRAEQLLVRWKDARPREPGLQHWGRLQSQRGQLAAFQGHAAQAISLFQEALAAFSRLSDPALGKAESAQTGTYLAIASMDAADVPLALVRERISAVVSLELEDIQDLAADSSPAKRFAHHLLLRYLVVHGTEAERAAYLSQRLYWTASTEHPWPLIIAYRGMLAWDSDTEFARRQFRTAAAHCAKAAHTLQQIGRAITAEAAEWEKGARKPTVMPRELPFNFR